MISFHNATPSPPGKKFYLLILSLLLSRVSLSLSHPIVSRGRLADVRVDVDVSVSETADREHHAVGVEGCAGDRAGPCGGEEGGVRVDGVDARAVDVEEGECVGVRAAVA